MKNLVLIRHSKSSWKGGISDLERPINERGQNDAELVSKEMLSKLRIEPDLILISPANRAKLTADIFVKNLNWSSKEIFIEPELYDFSGEPTFNVIQMCDDDVDTLVLFGHNPTFSILASQLGSEFIENVPTSGFVHLQFDIDSWENVNNGVTLKTIFPRDLKK